MDDRSGDDLLVVRKEQLVAFLRKNVNIVYFVLLALIILLTFQMRMQPVDKLRDTTTGQYIPAEPDSFIILYYAEYLLEHGQLPEYDRLRYYPNGFHNMKEFLLLPYFLVSLYKVLHALNSNVTLQFVDLLYSPLAFAISLLFFYLFLSKLFHRNVALVGTAYLSVTQLYLYRTMAGFSDKESLALLFIYASLYFFTLSWKTERSSRGVLFGCLAGISTAGAGLTWGGVQFLFFTYGLFAIFHLLLQKFNKVQSLAYACWFFVTYLLLHLVFPAKFGLSFAVDNLVIVPSSLAFGAALLYFVAATLKRPLFQNLYQQRRLGILCVVTVVLLGVLFILLLRGPQAFALRAQELFENLTHPFSVTRWARTVAESRQPYLRDLINEVGGFYFLLFLLGLLAMIYQCFASVKEHKLKLTIFLGIFFLTIMYTRYSSSSVLNGDSPQARFLFFGMLIVLPIFILIIYLYSRAKKIDVFSEFQRIDSAILFALCLALITLIGARSAIRLFIMVAPTFSFVLGYLFDFGYHKTALYKRRFLVVGYILIVLVVLFLPNAKGSLLQNYTTGYHIAQASGSSYHQQWQLAMKWARENTPEDAVFAHWWDYGYYVIYGSRRATLSDGGNTGGGGLNYFIGRHILTAQNNTEALEYLKSKGATHLLIVSDEIGKYPAYSSIGSNLSFDRYSYLTVFSLDRSKTQETRNQTVYVYVGGWAFDEDFVYDNQIFPAGSSAIGAFLVPMQVTENAAKIEQPEAILVYGTKQVSVPVECVVHSKQIIRFPRKGLEGCLLILPRLYGDEADYIGNVVYVSGKVSHTLFANLYLFGQDWKGFEVAYTDESQLPLAVYPQGNLFGPLKIWKITYPDGIEEKELYKRNELPDSRLAY